MILFYDEKTGKVVGSYHSYSSFEDKVNMPGYSEITAPEEVAQDINGSSKNTHTAYKVSDGEVVPEKKPDKSQENLKSELRHPKHPLNLGRKADENTNNGRNK